MLAIGRSVEHEMKRLRHRADALKSPPQQACEIRQATNTRRTCALKRRFMAARNHPGFVRNSRSIRTKRNVIATNLDDAQVLPLLLGQNVAKYTALFTLVVIASSAQLVEHASRHKRSCG